MFCMYLFYHILVRQQANLLAPVPRTLRVVLGFCFSLSEHNLYLFIVKRDSVEQRVHFSFHSTFFTSLGRSYKFCLMADGGHEILILGLILCQKTCLVYPLLQYFTSLVCEIVLKVEKIQLEL